MQTVQHPRLPMSQDTKGPTRGRMARLLDDLQARHLGIRERTSATSDVSDGMPRLRRDISDPIPLCTPPPVDVEPQESTPHLRREPNDISRRSRTCLATVSTHADRLRLGGPATDDPRVARKLAER